MKMLGMMRRWRGLLAAFGLLTLVALLPWGSRAERGVVGMEREVMAEQRGEGFGVESALSRGMMDAEGNAAGSVGIADAGAGRVAGGRGEAFSGGKPRKAEAQRTAQRVDARRLSGRRVRGGAPVLHIIKGPGVEEEFKIKTIGSDWSYDGATLYGDGAAIDGVVRFTVGQMSAGGTMYSEYRGPLGTYLVTVVRGEGSARELAVEENSVASGFSRWSVQEGNGSDIYVYVDKKVSIELKYRVDGQMNYELAPNELNVTYHGVRRVEWVHGGLGEFKDYVPQGAELHVKGVSGLVTLPDGKQAKLMSLVGGEQWLAGGPGQKGTSLEGTWKLPDNVSGGLEMVAVWRTDDETNRVVSFGVEGPGTMVVTDESGTPINNGQTLGSGVTALKVQATTNAGSELKGFLTNGRFFPLSGSVPAGGTRVSFPKEAKDVYLLTAFEKTRGEDPWWTITARGDIRNGKVELSAAEARENGYVLVTPHAAPGYMLTSLTYSYDGGRTTVDITQTRTIKMPAANVEVNAIFTKKPLKDVEFTVKGAEAGAIVSFVGADGMRYSGATGADGKALVKGVPVPMEGAMKIVGSVGGVRKEVSVPVTVDENGMASPAEFDFATATIYKVTLQVIDLAPTASFYVQNAVITVGDQVSDPTNFSGQTDLYLLSGTTYKDVSVTAPGYSPLRGYDLVVRDNGAAEKTIALYPLRKVSFGVKRDGVPVVGATVTLVDGEGTPYEGRTDASGVAQVPSVAAVPVPASGTITVMTQEGERVTVPVKVDVSGNATPREIDLSGANTGGVKVRVVDAATGAGIQDAVVAVSTLTEGVSDGDGYVTLHLLKGAKYFAVRTSATGYSPLNVVLTVDGNGAVTPGEIALEKRGVKNVTVRVIDNVANVAGARVTLVDGDGKFYEAVTDGNGEATVKDVPVPTEGTVTVEKDGVALTVPVTVDETGKADPATIDLNQSNGVWINIFDKVLVEPIEGAVVTVGAQVSDRSTIAGGGMVSLRLARGAKYSIKVSAPGYKDSILDLLIQPGGSADPKFIYLVRKGQKDVTVQVVDGNGNVEGAAVTIVDTDGRSYPAITGADGRAAMKDVPTPTAGTVTVEKDGKVVTVPVKVFPDGWMTPTPVSIAEENVRTVTVRVVEEGASPAKPIVGATVKVGAQAVQTTAPNGEAALRLIGKAEYPAVLATATGYDSRSVELTVDGNGAASPAVIALAKKARKDVTLRVVEGPDRVMGAEVTIADADGTIYRKVTDANGEVVVPKVLAPTQWLVTVEVSKNGVGKKVTARVDVGADGRPSPESIDLKVNSLPVLTILTVSLTVVDRQTGDPIEGAEVAIGTDRSVTEASGEVGFILGADGIYRVRASAAGYEEAYVDLAAYLQDAKYHPNKIELRKKAKSSVDVTVTDNGANVAGATVTIVDNDGKSHAATSDGNGGASVQDVPVPTVGTVTVEKDGKVVTVPVTVAANGQMTPAMVDISDADAREVVLKVVDSDTKQPIAGATVAIGAQAVQTGTTGEATLRLLKGVSYPMVKAEATGYNGTSVAVAVDGNGKATPGEIALEMRSTNISVTTDGSIPAVGATVTIVDGNGNAHAGVTDQHGDAKVKVSAPTAGTVTVKTQDGSKTITAPIAVDGNWVSDPNSINLGLPLNPVVFTVFGKDTPSSPLKNLEGATVTVGAQTVETNSNGKASLSLFYNTPATGVTTDYPNVKVAAVGYFDTIIALLKVDIVGFPDPTYCVLKKKPLKNVEVKVDGGATVTLVDGDGKSYTETDTDGNGEVVLPNVPAPTKGTVTVKTTDGKSVEVPVRVDKEGVMSPKDLKLYPVTIAVVDGQSHQPIKKATVTIGGQTSKTTGADGVATLYLVRGVTYTGVTAAAAGYLTSDEMEVAVDADGTATPDEIALTKKALADVTVTVKDGVTNVEGATVTLVDVDGKEYKEVTDGNGQAVMPKVPVPTEGTVTAEKNGLVVTVPVTVDADGVMTPGTVDLSDANIAEVTVKVVEKGTGNAIGGAMVTVGAQFRHTGTSGETALRLMRGATYTGVGATKPGYLPKTGVKLAVDAAGHANPGVIELEKKVLRPVTARVNPGATVTLVDSDGKSYTGTETGGSGKVTLADVPVPTEGKVTVTATVDGETRKLEVLVTVDKNGKMSPKDLTLYQVPVKVVEKVASPEVAIAGATVTVGVQQGTANSEGVATLYLVRGLTYEGVKAAAAGYEEAVVAELSVDAQGHVAPSVIYLEKKAVLPVTARVNPGATVTLVDGDGKSYKETDTDGNGEVVLPNVPVPTVGTVTVSVDGKTVTVPVTVDKDGVMSPKDLTLHPVEIRVVEKGVSPEKTIAGATVTIGGQPSVETGADGVATLYLVWGVTYEKGAAARAGYSTATISKLTVDEHGATDPGVVELEKKALELVTVTVKDGTTNVEGATVTLISSDGTRYEEKTDGNGEAAIQDVPVPTEGTVTVEKDGKIVTVPVEVDADGHINPPVVNIAEANVWPVKVTVVEKGASPEVPIAGATVTVGAQTSAATGADGVATLYLVKDRTYKEVKAVAAGYDDTCVVLTVDASGDYNPREMVLVKKAVKGVTVKVNESATVTLVDGVGDSHTATDSEARGEVSLPGVPVTTTGKVTVTATVGGKTRELEVPVTVDKDGTVHPGDLTLHPVTVKVVDSQSKQPIEGAKVTAGGQTSAAAGADGVVTLYLAKGLTYAEVKAGAAGYIDRSDITLSVFGQWPVVPGEIELVLKPRKDVTVSVDANATVTLVDADEKSYTGTETGGSGTVTLPNVPVPTTGTVTVEANGHTVKVPVRVDKDGNMSPSDLTLRAVTVRVVDGQSGQPISGATVTVGAQASAATGADGVATLYLVAGVTYTGVKAEAVRYEATTVAELKVTVTTGGSATATPDRIEMVPQKPYLHVFVVDENLRAIDGVSVSVKNVGSNDTDRAGHAAWQLTADKYDLTLEKKGYVTVTTSVELGEHGHDLTVVMQREAKADPKKEDPKGPVTAVESALLAGASLYPNPAREYTTLHGLEHAEMVRILTLSGVEVQRLAVPGEREHKLDVSRLAEGIYLVVLETRGGERRTLKLVVRR